MRHHNSVRKFGREKNARVALMKGLMLNLIKSERITTTEAKAKELRPMIEKLVTISKKTKTVAGRRLILSRLYNSAAGTKKLIDVIAPKYAERDGGYTRIMKLPPRLGDGSRMAIIEFI